MRQGGTGGLSTRAAQGAPDPQESCPLCPIASQKQRRGLGKDNETSLVFVDVFSIPHSGHIDFSGVIINLVKDSVITLPYSVQVVRIGQFLVAGREWVVRQRQYFFVDAFEMRIGKYLAQPLQVLCGCRDQVNRIWHARRSIGH